MKSRDSRFRFFLPAILFIALSSCSDSSESISPDIGGKGGSRARFTILGDYLYTVDKQNLKVFQLADPGNPRFIRTVPVGFGIETIFPFRDRLYIGSETAVYFFSVADPLNPVPISQALEPDLIRRCDPVVGNDTVAYATFNFSGPCGGSQSVLTVYDIRNLSRPLKITERNLESPFGLCFLGSVLYVCDGPNGLRLFNIRNAWDPQEFMIIKDGDFQDVIPYNGQLFCWVKTGLLVYSISDPANPAKVALIQ